MCIDTNIYMSCKFIYKVKKNTCFTVEHKQGVPEVRGCGWTLHGKGTLTKGDDPREQMNSVVIEL